MSKVFPDASVASTDVSGEESTNYLTDLMRIGELLSLVDYRITQLEDRKDIHDKLIKSKSVLKSMELSSQKKIDLSSKQLQDLIAQSMFEINKLVNGINTYIDAIESTRSLGSFFEPVSGPYTEEVKTIPTNMQILILLGVFFSLVISFSILSVRYIYNR